jgi:hypothetical protein
MSQTVVDLVFTTVTRSLHALMASSLLGHIILHSTYFSHTHTSLFIPESEVPTFTNSMELPVVHIHKNYAIFYGTQSFNIVYTTAIYWSLS